MCGAGGLVRSGWRLAGVAAAAATLSCSTSYLGPAGAVAPPLGAARPVDATDVRVPRGYRIEAVAARLDRPTDVVFDAHGNAHVLEGGRASPGRGDVSRSAAFGWVGRRFVAACDPSRAGAAPSVRGQPTPDASGAAIDLARNRDGGAAASVAGHGGLEQPVAARFDPSGRILWVVDHGLPAEGTTHCSASPGAVPRTGVLWKIEPVQPGG